MSERETDPQKKALDPPENTEETELNLVQSEPQQDLDPPENTKTKKAPGD